MMVDIAACRRVSMRVLPAALFCFASAQAASAAGLTVAWSPNTEADITSYAVSYGPSSGAQSQTIAVPASVTCWPTSFQGSESTMVGLMVSGSRRASAPPDPDHSSRTWRCRR